jgi:putative addiction module killer protein
MEATPRKVESLEDFDDYMDGLTDPKGKAQLESRVNKLRRGLLRDYDSVGEGVIELRLDNVGPGYRISAGDDGINSLLLCAGTKRTQNSDIAHAKLLWKDYKDAKE